MGSDDRASDIDEANFKKSKRKILEIASSLSPSEYSYLDNLLEQLGFMTACCLYGNGEIPVYHDLPEYKEKALLSNYKNLIRAELGISLYFPCRYSNRPSPLGRYSGMFVTEIYFDHLIFYDNMIVEIIGVLAEEAATSLLEIEWITGSYKTLEQGNKVEVLTNAVVYTVDEILAFANKLYKWFQQAQKGDTGQTIDDAIIIINTGKRLRLKNATLGQLKELLED